MRQETRGIQYPWRVVDLDPMCSFSVRWETQRFCGSALYVEGRSYNRSPCAKERLVVRFSAPLYYLHEIFSFHPLCCPRCAKRWPVRAQQKEQSHRRRHSMKSLKSQQCHQFLLSSSISLPYTEFLCYQKGHVIKSLKSQQTPLGFFPIFNVLPYLAQAL